MSSAPNINAGANTVTIAQNGTSVTMRGVIAEFSGLVTFAMSDNYAANSIAGGSSTTVSSGSVSTGNANDLLKGATYNVQGVDGTPGDMGTGSGNATVLQDVATGKLLSFYDIVNITGSYQANETLNTAATWGAGFVAYKGTSLTFLPIMGQICL
jgi:hypothetical protein